MKRSLLALLLVVIVMTGCSKMTPKEEDDKATDQISQLEEQQTDNDEDQANDDQLLEDNEQLDEENTKLEEENSQLIESNEELEESSIESEDSTEPDPLESLIGMTFKSENTSIKYNSVLGEFESYSYIVFTDSDKYPVLIDSKIAEKSYSELKDGLNADGIQGTRRPYRSTITTQDNVWYKVEIVYTDLFDKKPYTYSFDFYINDKGADYGISVSNVVTNDEQPDAWDGHYLVAE